MEQLFDASGRCQYGSQPLGSQAARCLVEKTRPVFTVGQLSVDTVVRLARPLLSSLGDQMLGDYCTSLGGSAAIVAHNFAALGGAPTFVGLAGSDAEDERAVQQLGSAGVKTVILASGCGLRVTVVVDPDGQRTMVANRVHANWRGLSVRFPASALVYFEGWPLFEEGVSRGHPYCALIRRASNAGATVVLDVCAATRAVNVAEYVRLLRELPLDVVLANDAEAQSFRLLTAPVAPITIAHRGPDATLIVVGARLVPVPVVPVHVTDTTGAGDTFAAGLLMGLAIGEPLLVAVERAHAAARNVVTTTGALLSVKSPSDAIES